MDTQTLTLTDLLLARIADDEMTAHQSLSDPWRVGHTNSCDWWGDMPGYCTCKGTSRLLAECEAKRRIVEFHKSWPVLVDRPAELEPLDANDIGSVTFRMSRQIAWMTEQEYRSRFGDEPPTAPMLRALASVYSDHPDFRPEWA